MTTKVNLSDEDLFTAIAGAGASQYPWYVRFDIDWDALTLDVEIDLEDVQASSRLTPTGLRTTIAFLVDANTAPAVTQTAWSDPEVDSDVDADIADCVIQFALLGDVVFG